MAYNVAQQYIVEVLPTVARAQGSGAIHTLGIGASMTVPYIVYMVSLFLYLAVLMFVH